MVELKKTKRIYAMKVIKKALVTDDEVSLEQYSLKYSKKFKKRKPQPMYQYFVTLTLL